MFLIEDVTGRSFSKERIHMPFRPNPTKKSLIPPAQVSSPPRADPTPQQQHKAAEPVRPVGYSGQIRTRAVFSTAERKILPPNQKVV
jgi:hypothetical protein